MLAISQAQAAVPASLANARNPLSRVVVTIDSFAAANHSDSLQIRSAAASAMHALRAGYPSQGAELRGRPSPSPWLHTWGSGCFSGIARDAEYGVG